MKVILLVWLALNQQPDDISAIEFLSEDDCQAEATRILERNKDVLASCETPEMWELIKGVK